jgi:hypothetical protein
MSAPTMIRREAARILAESIDFTRQGQLTLREVRPR